MTQVKTGAEIHREYFSSHEYVSLIEMIDANTALAVAEAKRRITELDELHSDALELLDQEEARHEVTLQELELYKSQCLMLFHVIETFDGYFSDLSYISDCNQTEPPTRVWNNERIKALFATKESIKAYRNEIVQKAKSEQRESDAKLFEYDPSVENLN